MTKYKIIGLESFNSKSGKPITKIYAVYQSDRVSGLGCEIFIAMKDVLPDTICVDQYFVPLFGRYGDKGFLAGINIID